MRMNILHINCNYITTALHQTMIEHLDKIVNNSVFVPVYDKNRTIISTNKNVYVSECFKKWNRILFYYKQNKIYKSIVNKYKMNSFDIIHAYTLFTDGNCAMKLYKKYNIPYVVAIRDTDVNAFFKYRFYLRKRGIEIMKNASAIFFLSEAYLKEVTHKYVSQRLTKDILNKSYVIPNGIDDFWIEKKNNNRKTKETLLRIKNKRLKIIFVGQIIKRKNISLILKAISKMEKEDWNIEFNAIGKKVDNRLFNKLSRDVNFTYLGQKNKEELVDFYRSSDIFIMPSHTETFGLVYAEAMSQGLPVIYTKGQGFDGQFQEGKVGFRVGIKNEYDIIEAINRICKEYNDISKNCSRLVDKFRWDYICKEYYNIYSSIVTLKGEILTNGTEKNNKNK